MRKVKKKLSKVVGLSRGGRPAVDPRGPQSTHFMCLSLDFMRFPLMFFICLLISFDVLYCCCGFPLSYPRFHLVFLICSSISVGFLYISVIFLYVPEIVDS